MSALTSRLQAIVSQHGAALLLTARDQEPDTDHDTWQLVARLAAADPSSDLSAMPWLVNQTLAGTLRLDNLVAAREALERFCEHRQSLPEGQRRLDGYPTLTALLVVTATLPGCPPNPVALPGAENFRRWFGASQVVDAAGQPLAVYHSTRESFTAFEPQRGKDAGFHFGTREQALMRSGPRGTVLEVYLAASRLKRVRDDGQWNKAKIAAARRQGFDGIVYLNRYEGMTTERIEALSASSMLARLDTLSDTQFRRLVPEAADSFIVFEPTQIKSTSNPGTWSPSDPRIDDGGNLTEEAGFVAPGLR